MQHPYKPTLASSAILMLTSVVGSSTYADSLGDALAGGKAYADFRLRYEAADQDNTLEDASALTLRTRLGYNTAAINGFSATLEAEDVRTVAGEDDFTVGPSNHNPGHYSVIADPETTELDQGFIQYSTETTTTRLGRQVLTFDNHRFVGHVGWRQDRQTFDAFSTDIGLGENALLRYAYIEQRNRIFAEDADFDSQDHLFNVSYATAIGKLTGYAYLLEVDNDIDNSLDTYGVRFTGATLGDGGTAKFLYAVEYASQEAETNNVEFDTDYWMVEGGLVFKGVTAKLGIETLGSDDGNVGFATPLATMHKFNGWADMFLTTPKQGLVDTSLSVASKLGGGNLTLAYHDFEADEASGDIDDLGDEIDVVYAKKFGQYYNAGIKYASYTAGDTKVDTDRFWVWVGASF